MPVLEFHLDERSPFFRLFNISEDARLPDLEIQVLDNETPVDLTGATVAFSMDNRAGTAKVDAQAGAVVDGPEGIVKYSWASGDTDTPAVYFGQFKITVGGVDYLIPNNDTQRLQVTVGAKIN